MACTASHDPVDNNQLSLSSTNEELESAALKVINQKCSACHGPNSNSGGIGDLSQIEYLISSGLITPGDSSLGRLIGSISESSMPPSSSVSSDELTILKNWIDFGFTKNANTQTPSQTGLGGSPLQIEALTIVQNKCFACHGSSNGAGGVSNIGNISHLLTSGLITKGDPNKGAFMASIYNGSMPTSAPLSSKEISVLESWILSDIDATAQDKNPTIEKLEPTFSSISKNILTPKCVACHGPNRADENIRVDSYGYLMGQIGNYKSLVVPTRANESKLYKSTVNSEMPPTSDGYTSLSVAELQTIAEWINDGAANN